MCAWLNESSSVTSMRGMTVPVPPPRVAAAAARTMTTRLLQLCAPTVPTSEPLAKQEQASSTLALSSSSSLSSAAPAASRNHSMGKAGRSAYTAGSSSSSNISGSNNGKGSSSGGGLFPHRTHLFDARTAVAAWAVGHTAPSRTACDDSGSSSGSSCSSATNFNLRSSGGSSSASSGAQQGHSFSMKRGTAAALRVSDLPLAYYEQSGCEAQLEDTRTFIENRSAASSCHDAAAATPAIHVAFDRGSTPSTTAMARTPNAPGQSTATAVVLKRGIASCSSSEFMLNEFAAADAARHITDAVLAVLRITGEAIEDVALSLTQYPSSSGVDESSNAAVSTVSNDFSSRSNSDVNADVPSAGSLSTSSSTDAAPDAAVTKVPWTPRVVNLASSVEHARPVRVQVTNTASAQPPSHVYHASTSSVSTASSHSSSIDDDELMAIDLDDEMQHQMQQQRLTNNTNKRVRIHENQQQQWLPRSAPAPNTRPAVGIVSMSAGVSTTPSRPSYAESAAAAGGDCHPRISSSAAPSASASSGVSSDEMPDEEIWAAIGPSHGSMKQQQQQRRPGLASSSVQPAMGGVPADGRQPITPVPATRAGGPPTSRLQQQQRRYAGDTAVTSTLQKPFPVDRERSSLSSQAASSPPDGSLTSSSAGVCFRGWVCGTNAFAHQHRHRMDFAKAVGEGDFTAAMKEEEEETATDSEEHGEVALTPEPLRFVPQKMRRAAASTAAVSTGSSGDGGSAVDIAVASGPSLAPSPYGTLSSSESTASVTFTSVTASTTSPPDVLRGDDPCLLFPVSYTLQPSRNCGGGGCGGSCSASVNASGVSGAYTDSTPLDESTTPATGAGAASSTPGRSNWLARGPAAAAIAAKAAALRRASLLSARDVCGHLFSDRAGRNLLPVLDAENAANAASMANNSAAVEVGAVPRFPLQLTLSIHESPCMTKQQQHAPHGEVPLLTPERRPRSSAGSSGSSSESHRPGLSPSSSSSTNAAASTVYLPPTKTSALLVAIAEACGVAVTACSLSAAVPMHDTLMGNEAGVTTADDDGMSAWTSICGCAECSAFSAGGSRRGIGAVVDRAVVAGAAGASVHSTAAAASASPHENSSSSSSSGGSSGSSGRKRLIPTPIERDPSFARESCAPNIHPDALENTDGEASPSLHSKRSRITAPSSSLLSVMHAGGPDGSDTPTANLIQQSSTGSDGATTSAAGLGSETSSLRLAGSPLTAAVPLLATPAPAVNPNSIHPRTAAAIDPRAPLCARRAAAALSALEAALHLPRITELVRFDDKATVSLEGLRSTTTASTCSATGVTLVHPSISNNASAGSLVHPSISDSASAGSCSANVRACPPIIDTSAGGRDTAYTLTPLASRRACAVARLVQDPAQVPQSLPLLVRTLAVTLANAHVVEDKALPRVLLQQCCRAKGAAAVTESCVDLVPRVLLHGAAAAADASISSRDESAAESHAEPSDNSAMQVDRSSDSVFLGTATMLTSTAISHGSSSGSSSNGSFNSSVEVSAAHSLIDQLLRVSASRPGCVVCRSLVPLSNRMLLSASEWAELCAALAQFLGCIKVELRVVPKKKAAAAATTAASSLSSSAAGAARCGSSSSSSSSSNTTVAATAGSGRPASTTTAAASSVVTVTAPPSASPRSAPTTPMAGAAAAAAAVPNPNAEARRQVPVEGLGAAESAVATADQQQRARAMLDAAIGKPPKGSGSGDYRSGSSSGGGEWRPEPQWTAIQVAVGRGYGPTTGNKRRGRL